MTFTECVHRMNFEVLVVDEMMFELFTPEDDPAGKSARNVLLRKTKTRGVRIV